MGWRQTYKHCLEELPAHDASRLAAALVADAESLFTLSRSGRKLGIKVISVQGFPTPGSTISTRTRATEEAARISNITCVYHQPSKRMARAKDHTPFGQEGLASEWTVTWCATQGNPR